MISTRDRISGSLLGGAAGDALGAPVEFLSLSQIRAEHGPAGITHYAPAYGRLGAVTDDTQMTMFTAEGVLRAWVRAAERGICNVQGVIHHAYLRWLLTQGERPARISLAIGTDGWLWSESDLHHRRAPGNTCLSALRASEGFGSPPRAKNNSKGCGGVMRVAPIGLFAPAVGDDERVFGMALDAAAVTHGHPSGFLSAGHFAVTIAALLRGEPLESALDAADALLLQQPGHEELSSILGRARAMGGAGRPSPEDLEQLGGGWVAEEALAIAVCCSLAAKDFADGIRLAANHGGDSDSTAAIAGNLLGALLGRQAIAAEWLDRLEFRDALDRLAADLHEIGAGRVTSDTAWDSYPGW